MCTASWLITPGGYELFFNRDERRTRLPATPPTRQQRDGVTFLAPRDGDAGGTWLAVNEFGLSIALLNYYPTSATTGKVSRGLLVLSLVTERTPADVAARLGDEELTEYQPLLLLALAPNQRPHLLRWDGAELSLDINPKQPVTTSSFDTATVVARRQVMYSTTRGEAFHLSRDERGDAYSVCMTRDDAQTVSFSHITVSPGSITFRYRARDGDGFAAPEVARV